MCCAVVCRNSLSGSLKQLAMGQHQGNAGGLGSYETVQHFNDIKEHLHVVKRNIEHIIQKNANPAEKLKCPELPPLPTCLSTTHFLIFIVIQSLLFFGYIMYKSQQEAAAKKFFWWFVVLGKRSTTCKLSTFVNFPFVFCWQTVNLFYLKYLVSLAVFCFNSGLFNLIRVVQYLNDCSFPECVWYFQQKIPEYDVIYSLVVGHYICCSMLVQESFQELDLLSRRRSQLWW